MYLIDDVKELRRAAKKVKSGCSQDTLFMAKASLLSCEMLAGYFKRFDALATEILRRVPAARKNGHRKLSAWNLFAGKRLKAGKSLQEVAKEWAGKEKQTQLIPIWV